MSRWVCTYCGKNFLNSVLLLLFVFISANTGIASNFYPSEDIDEIQRKAIEGKVEYQYQLGIIYCEGILGHHRPDEGARWMLKVAKQGYPDAENYMGDLYRFGIGVKKNASEAIKWYRQAIEHGSALAEFNMGTIYESGEGVSQSNDEAFKWHSVAAKHGVKKAWYHLGLAYEFGFGVKADTLEAIMCHIKAFTEDKDIRYERIYEAKERLEHYVPDLTKVAEKGNPKAQCALGLICLLVKGDYSDATKWLRKSAKQGYAEAQFNLADVLSLQRNVDYRELMALIDKTAKQGHAKAQFALGMNLFGERDGGFDWNWISKSAEQGYAPALHSLAVRYMYGYGVKRNPEEAIKLWCEAARQGYLPAIRDLRGCGVSLFMGF